MKKKFLKYEFLLLVNNKLSKNNPVLQTYNENLTKEEIRGIESGIHNAAFACGKKRPSQVLVKVYTDGSWEQVDAWDSFGKVHVAMWEYKPTLTTKELSDMWKNVSPLINSFL